MTRRVALVVALAALLLSSAPAFDARQTPGRVVITERFTPAEQKSGRYQYIPFDVPNGTDTLRVSYDYDRANGENVVDLGLFEPGPLELGTKAFRGYSGGARSEVVLTSTDATPGYRRGALPSGRWHALLGLYRIALAGVDVTLTIEVQASRTITIADHAPLESPSVNLGARWYTGALHTHTLHSDGTVTPRDLLSMFAAKGFDFVAITDHNNTTHTQEFSGPIPHRPLLITGEEVTTPGGHASVWGLPEGGWVDFRVLPGDPRVKDLVASARRQGAMFSINHPASECLACGWTHEIVEGIEGIEISNGRHGEVEHAMAMWDKLLASGRRITGVGSSDWHSAPNQIDNAHVRVYASSLTQASILAGIRAGRVIVMTNANDATPEVAVRIGEIVAAVGDTLPLEAQAPIEVEVTASGAPGGGLVLVVNGQRRDPIPLDAQGRAHLETPSMPGYVRFEILRGDGTAFAYTNPVYLVR